MAEELYSEIFGKNDEIDATKILNELIDNKTGQIRMKSHILTPMEIAMLHSLSDYYKKLKMPILSKFIYDLAVYYEELMCSYQRKSREEITKVLSSRMEDTHTTRSTFDKLLGKKGDM
jgi:hypothetical protein